MFSSLTGRSRTIASTGARTAELVAELRAGARIAVVSDAGMPGISDPGSFLVKAAIEAGVNVVPVPGANAALSALIASGLNTDEFLFLGFLPPKTSARRTRLQAVAEKLEGPLTLVIYEAPHRIRESLEDIVEVLGGSRHTVIAREVTKLHEEFLRGRADELLEVSRSRELKGEITLLIAKAE